MKNTSRKIKIAYGDLMNITAMSIETITGIQGRVLLSESELGILRGMILHWRAMASQFGLSDEVMDRDMDWLCELAGIPVNWPAGRSWSDNI